jgi:hypothetical protein
MRKLIHITLIFFVIPITSIYGQSTNAFPYQQAKKNILRPSKRNVIWFTPTRANEINGLALGTIPSSVAYNNDSLKINGIHIETNPIMFMLVPNVLIGSLTSPFRRENDSSYFSNSPPDSNYFISSNSINGINISTLGSGEMSNYCGISISSIATLGYTINGISITIGQNTYYKFRGLLIAGLMNSVNTGRGVQIGLFNRCKDCKGLQIGLLNKMGKRTLPFLNVRL